MPLLSRWMIKCAMIYLLVGFSLGGLLLVGKGGWGTMISWSWLPVHIELLLLGWTLQFAWGVAYWIYPRFRRVERPRGGLGWAAFVLLNVGIVVCVLSFLRAGWRELLFVGRLLEVFGFVCFAAHLWPRIKPMESPGGLT